MQYIYYFEDKGSIAPEALLPNQIWVDVGGADRDGVFDNHRHGGKESALECVFQHPARLKQAMDYIRSCSGSGQDPEIEFHLHFFPDLDCIASVYVIRKVLEGDRTEAEPVSVLGERISGIIREYVNSIDRGRQKHTTDLTALAYLYSLGDRTHSAVARSKLILEEGLKLMQLIVEGLEVGRDDINLFTDPLERYVDVSCLDQIFYQKARMYIESARRHYEEDRKNKRVVFRKIRLWNREKRREEDVTAAVWEKLPSGEDGYLYAREMDACMLTVYPYAIREDGEDGSCTAVIIALNPDLESADQYTLRPIAEILEQCEQIEEAVIYARTGRYRRDHSRPREEWGIFGEEPFSETSDPWYITEAEDLIDAPRRGSLLNYEQVLSIIKSASSMVREAEIIRYRYAAGEERMAAVIYGKKQRISLGSLYFFSREVLEDTNRKPGDDYLFALVRIHPDTLRYNNALLRYICLNMVGKSSLGSNEDNILFLDYRTCLYADQTITIVVEAGTRNQALKKLLAPGPGEAGLLQSEICGCLRRLAGHRHRLRAIGTRLPKMMERGRNSEESVEELNTELVRLNTTLQKDDIIPDSNMQEIYSFVREKLGIEDLKKTVLQSAEFLIGKQQQEWDKKEEDRDRGLQMILGLFAILGIFSALTDGWDLFYRWSVGSEWRILSGYGISRMAAGALLVAVILLIGGITIRYAIPLIYSYMKDKQKGRDKDPNGS